MPVAMVHDTELRHWTQVVWACSSQKDGRHLCHETRVFAPDLPHHQTQTLLLGTKRLSSEGCARAVRLELCSRWDKAARSFTYAWRAKGGHPFTHRSCPIRRRWPSRGTRWYTIYGNKDKFFVPFFSQTAENSPFLSNVLRQRITAHLKKLSTFSDFTLFDLAKTLWFKKKNAMCS